MNSTEKWGTDVETATELALQELGLTKDEVEITVLEEPSKGFFGIGAKLALVRVEKKGTKKETKPEKEKNKKTDKKENKQVKENKKQEKENEQNKEEKQTEKNKKEKLVVEKTEQEKKTEDPLQCEEIDKEKIKSVIDENIPKELVPCEDHPGLTFLEEMIKEMGLNLAVTAKQGENYLYLEISGDETGIVIGKRGQTLDAIQYLVSLVVNKGDEEYTRVIVDAENYREKREETLMRLANRLAEKAIRTGKNVKLEPMNPYERKVIHSTLQANEFVTTRSEGEGSYRRVIIELK